MFFVLSVWFSHGIWFEVVVFRFSTRLKFIRKSFRNSLEIHSEIHSKNHSNNPGIFIFVFEHVVFLPSLVREHMPAPCFSDLALIVTCLVTLATLCRTPIACQQLR